MENINLFNDILAAMKRGGADIEDEKGLTGMIVLLRRCAKIDTMTLDVFLDRMKKWLENECGIMFTVYTTETGAFAYNMTGVADKRLYRYASRERATAACIIRGIEMIKEKQ